MKKQSEAGSTTHEARKGSVSAPAVVTMIASFRFCGERQRGGTSFVPLLEASAERSRLGQGSNGVGVLLPGSPAAVHAAARAVCWVGVRGAQLQQHVLGWQDCCS